MAPPALVQELVPDVHARPYYQRYGTPTFFKSHHLPRPEYRRVVYLLRDGRDVMVSYFHHLVALKGEGIDFSALVQSGQDLFPCKWHKHVEAWLANPYQAQMLVIKYEDLKAQTAHELQRFCQFANLERSAAFLREVAEGSAFEKMRDKEIKAGVGDPQWPKDKLFRRRGAVGSYKDEMSPEVLSAFLTESSRALHQCGYS
jgi:hypothetical protein